MSDPKDSGVIHQNFHGNATNIAGRDFVQNTITSINLLHVLETAVTQSSDIPEPQKASLLNQLRKLAANPYISSLATNSIYDLLKSSLTGL